MPSTAWDGAGRTGSSAERFRLGHWLGGAHDSYRLAWTSGPDRVHGKNWELLMPGLATALDDDQIASILTYVRREWGHTASPVDPQEVKSVRDQYPGREDMWTVADLVKLP